MRRFQIMLVSAVFVLALLAFACTYTVRFTHAAVLTTFGKAGEGAVKREPGLYFKAPYPFASVMMYDTRLRTKEVKFETQQTADSKQVVVETFCTWRVEDPLKFFRRFSNEGSRAEQHYSGAEKAIESSLRSAIGLLSKYNMDDLFTTGAQGSRLAQLERDMQALLNDSPTLRDAGVSVASVGIMRVVLPEETTKAVFTRMQANRDAIAKEIEARGNAEAQAIRSTAENDAKRIQEFADRLATEIRTLGDRESAQYYLRMRQKPELAEFLAAMDFLTTTYGKRTTLVLSGSTPGVGLLFPEALMGLRDGEVPPIVRPLEVSHALTRQPAGPSANTPASTESPR